MSKNSNSPLKHIDQLHRELTKEKHITAHGGDAEAAGYKEEKPEEIKIGENEAGLLFESITNPFTYAFISECFL